MSNIPATIAQRYTRIQERICQAARQAGRNEDEVTLIAVSKTRPTADVQEAYAAGLRHFGENRPQELTEKATEFAPDDLVWHYIAALQSRQTAAVAQFAHLFHALERGKIARRLDVQRGERSESGRGSLPVLLQVNISGEASKAGIASHRWEEDAAQRAQLHALAEQVAHAPHLTLAGLMTMAPWHAPSAEIQQVFERTRRLRDWLATAVPSAPLDALSMGMSDDFELAIAAGATHIRLGRVLFGERT